MPYTREQITKLIGEHERVKNAISAHEKENRSPMAVFEGFITEWANQKAYELKHEAIEFIKKNMPIKGVHYFDGEKGEQGEMGERGIPGIRGEQGDAGTDGIDGKNGKDGKSISPKEAKLMLADLLKDIKADDLGALTLKDAEKMLKKYESTSSKSLEKRLNALQDAVMRNYGGHGGSRVFYYDLSAQLDGASKTFTIASHSKIVQVTSSSAPFVFRPSIDFTDTATTITFDASIDAPSMLAQGQSIIILLIP